jgi:hypothetical protein
MSFSIFIARVARPSRSHLKVALTAIVLVIAVAASAPATYAVGCGSPSLRSRGPGLASVLRPLTPNERHYVVGIMSLTPIQLWAAFGTSHTPPRTPPACDT